MTQAKVRSPRQWRGSVHYTNNPVLREYSGGTFAQVKAEMVADLPDRYAFQRALETDSFIEYNVVWRTPAGHNTKLVGVAEIQEVRGE